MRDKEQNGPVDAAVAPLAARQHGVVSHRQLVPLGVSRSAIARRVRSGRLHRVHQGVYAVGHPRLTQRGRWMAAVLAGGPDAALSRRSAAALWQLLTPAGPIHVIVPRELRNRDGIEFHAQSLQFDEVAEHDGIRVTTVARTLLDLAGREPARFEQALNEAEYRRLHDTTGLAHLHARYPSCRGTAILRKALQTPAAGRIREELEHSFQALVEKQGLPTPERNVDLELEPGRWIQADCIWRDARLVVELDGRGAHTTARRFDSDRERDRLLALDGWQVVRVTHRHLTTDGARVASDLRKLLARKR
jgi:predicted transcriptional regulator of viral defense system